MPQERGWEDRCTGGEAGAGRGSCLLPHPRPQTEHRGLRQGERGQRPRLMLHFGPVFLLPAEGCHTAAPLKSDILPLTGKVLAGGPGGAGRGGEEGGVGAWEFCVPASSPMKVRARAEGEQVWGVGQA